VGEFGTSTSIVADWRQAGIGYTFSSSSPCVSPVADWRQAGIGYTTEAT